MGGSGDEAGGTRARQVASWSGAGWGGGLR